MRSRHEDGPAGNGADPMTQVDAEVDLSLRHRPDHGHRSPTGAVRYLLLSVDPIDVALLTAVALTWPLGWWSA